jgi:hypothetical protein
MVCVVHAYEGHYCPSCAEGDRVYQEKIKEEERRKEDERKKKEEERKREEERKKEEAKK